MARTRTGKIQLGPQHEIAFTITNDDARLPAVVLLNGSVFNYRQWNRLISAGILPHYDRAYRIFRYDYGGVGYSTTDQPKWNIFALGDELHELLKKLDFGPVHLYGISKGTMVGQIFSLRYPTMVKSLSGYGWYYGGYSELGRVQEFFRRRLGRVRKMEDLWDLQLTWEVFKRLWDEAYRQIVFGKDPAQFKITDRVRDFFLQRMVYPLITPTPIRRIYDWFDYVVNNSEQVHTFIAAEFDTLKRIPMLIQHSVGDKTLPIGMARELKARLPHAKMIEYPEEYTHVSPALVSAQASTLMQDYLLFLRSIELNDTASVSDRPGHHR